MQYGGGWGALFPVPQFPGDRLLTLSYSFDTITKDDRDFADFIDEMPELYGLKACSLV